MRNIILLHDRAANLRFLVSGLEDKDFTVRLINNKSNKSDFLHWVKGCLITLYKSEKNDVIICWFDFQAIICWWMGLFLLRRRRIVAINLLLKDKGTVRNKVVSYMYKHALKSKYLKATVTTQGYGNLLCQKLGIDVKFSLLRDIYIQKEQESTLEDCGRTVFCGGNNGRDWKIAISVAERMKNTNFTFVVPPAIKRHLNNIPSNVCLYSSIPESEFDCLMKKCSVVFLPLDTNAPAGLIVMFKAAAFGKGVVTTGTPVTEEYFRDNRGLIGNSIEDYKNLIEILLSDITQRKQMAFNFRNYLEVECSEEKYIKCIIGIIRKFEFERYSCK